MRAAVADHSREALLVAGLTAAALVLRFIGLSEGDFWADEIATHRAVADRTPGDVLVVIQAGEGAPHLYYLLAWAWSGVLGAGEAGLRSLSAIAGALVTPVAYLTLRQVGLRTEALIAGGLAAVSPLLVWYGQEARMYSLLTLLTAAALFFFVRLLVNFDVRALIAWSIACVAALLTHYFAVFTVIGMAAVLVYRHRARRRVIALALLPTAATAFALLPTFASQRDNATGDWVSEISLPERVLQIPEHFLTGFAYPPLAVVLLAGLAAAVGGAGLLFRDRLRQLVGGSLLGIVAVCVAVLVIAVAVNRDFVLSRYLLGVLIPLLLAVSVGLGAPRLRPVGPVIAVALVGLLAAISVAGEYDQDVERPSWGEAAEAIADGGDPDVVLACCGTLAAAAPHYFPSFDAYDEAMGEVEVRQVVLATIPRPDHRPANDFCWWGGQCQADDVLGPGPPGPEPEKVSQALSSIFNRVDTFTHGSVRVERYQSATPVALNAQSGLSLQEGNFVEVGNDEAVNGIDVLVRSR
jgi:hypothetical protein